jgi:hypothetical protein
MSGGSYASPSAEGDGTAELSDAEGSVVSWLEDDALDADDASGLSMQMLGKVPDVLDVLSCAPDVCKRPSAGFSCPLDKVKNQRSNLPSNWDPMDGAACIVVDIMDPETRNAEREAECKQVLAKMFKLEMELKDVRLHEVLENIRTRTKYNVLRVERAQNVAQWRMHCALGAAYDIEDNTDVYHGTEAKNKIFKTGFSLRYQRPGRNLYGNGVYFAKDAAIAILFADPRDPSNGDWTQTIICASLKKGETRLGEKGLVETGENPETGKEYLTMQNPDGRILVATKEQQALPTYAVEFTYDFDSEITPTDIKFGRLQDAVWKEVLRRKALAEAPAIETAAITENAPQRPPKKPRVSHVIEDGTQAQAHNGFKVGEVVRVHEHFKHFKFCNGELGRIERIEKRRVWMFVLEMQNPATSSTVEVITRKGNHGVDGVPLHQLVCKHGQIRKLAVVQGGAAGGVAP